MSPALPPRRVLRALAVWAVLSLAAAPALVGAMGEAALVACLGAFAAAAGAMTGRSGLFLAGAREGLALLDASARPHQLWRGALPPLVLALAGGAPLGLAVGLAPPSFASAAGLLLGATSMGLLLSLPFVRRELARPRAQRRTSLFAWLVVDGGLPAGTLAAGFGALVALSRGALQTPLSPSETSRHLALTLFAYALLLGLAGAMKAGREQRAGLVVAPKPPAKLPGPLATGGVLGVVVLLLGPRALEPVLVEQLVVVKVVLGLVVGTALAALGGARAAGAEPPGR